jgi:hypothetical protein
MPWRDVLDQHTEVDLNQKLTILITCTTEAVVIYTGAVRLKYTTHQNLDQRRRGYRRPTVVIKFLPNPILIQSIKCHST